MEQDPAAVIDEELGREIALRESLSILVACSISQVGEEYSLMAKLLDPESGTSVLTETARANGENEILDSLDELAERIRSGLGESLATITHERTPLPAATTSSLDALKEFAAGELAFGQRRFEAAHLAFETAIAADSTFAMAHARLGASYYWSGLGPKGEPHFEQALAWKSRLTHRERLLLNPFIAGWRGHRDKAIEGYQIYLQSYPDDSSGWFQLGYQYTREGRCDEARDAFARVLELNPREAAAHINIATCFSTAGRNEEALEHYLEAFELQPTWRTSSNLNHEFGFVYAGLGRLQEAEETFRLMLDKGQEDRGRGLRSLALLEMLRGRYSIAESHLEESARIRNSLGHWLSEARDRLYLAAVYHRRGNLRAGAGELRWVRERFEQDYPGSSWVTYAGSASGRAGDVEALQEMLSLIEENQNPELREDRAAALLLRGELMMAQGDPAGAIEALELAMTLSPGKIRSEAAATAHYRAGNLQPARRYFEEVVAEAPIGWEAQEAWLESHYWLGRIDQELGDLPQSLRWYESLLELWEGADSDLELLQETQRRALQVRTALAG